VKRVYFAITLSGLFACPTDEYLPKGLGMHIPRDRSIFIFFNSALIATGTDPT